MSDATASHFEQFPENSETGVSKLAQYPNFESDRNKQSTEKWFWITSTDDSLTVSQWVGLEGYLREKIKEFTGWPEAPIWREHGDNKERLLGIHRVVFEALSKEQVEELLQPVADKMRENWEGSHFFHKLAPSLDSKRTKDSLIEYKPSDSSLGYARGNARDHRLYYRNIFEHERAKNPPVPAEEWGFTDEELQDVRDDSTTLFCGGMEKVQKILAYHRRPGATREQVRAMIDTVNQLVGKDVASIYHPDDNLFWTTLSIRDEDMHLILNSPNREKIEYALTHPNAPAQSPDYVKVILGAGKGADKRPGAGGWAKSSAND